MLYGPAAPDTLARAQALAGQAQAARPAALRALDAQRQDDPLLFAGNEGIGYAAYVDRFAGTLAGVAGRIPYLRELGVRYLHLLPFLKMRAGANDGGFAVCDYGAVDPAFGNLAALSSLTSQLHAAGISLCADLVINHTADDHPWALAAKAGDRAKQAYYLLVDNAEEAAAWEASLPQVFAETAPGNFTWSAELKRHVWTSFYPYQWDLNWANPEVFLELLGALYTLANHGVDVFRLDSAPFLWKRKGTDCRNLPETHQIIRALRAFTELVMPGVLLKAEAIVPSTRLNAYFGSGAAAGRECQLAYHTTLMTLSWAALAEGGAQRLARVLAAMPAPPPGCAWLTYVRCHDDIGWSVLEGERAGGAPQEWRALTAQVGRFYTDPAGFSAGAAFQVTPGAVPHGVSGTLASLCGLDKALASGDAAALDCAIARMLLLQTVSFGYGGLPLLNSGDELGQRNDPDFRTGARFDGDNRWLHRGAFDPAAAARRLQPGTVEARVFAAVQALVQARSRTPSPMAAPAQISADPASVLRLLRPGALVLANFSPEQASADLPAGRWRDVLDAGEPVHAGSLQLRPHQACWLLQEQ